MSSKNPLISGFYKLNTLCMKISIKNDYFEIVNNSVDNNDGSSSCNETMQIDDPIHFEKLNCFNLYKKYVKEISVRKKQFKDELLASSLEFVLSLPKELVDSNLEDLFESLEVILIT